MRVPPRAWLSGDRDYDCVSRSKSESMEDGCSRARVTEVASGWSMDLAPRLPGTLSIAKRLNAVAAARIAPRSAAFAISDEAITQGIAERFGPGVSRSCSPIPDVYLDGAHNPSAARELATFWAENFTGRKIYLLYGALRDKAVDEVAGVLFPHRRRGDFHASRAPRARFPRRSSRKSRRTTRRRAR